MSSRLTRLLVAVFALAIASSASAQTASWVVKDRNLATPPGSPAEGDRYIVAASSTGAWAGHANDIAVRSSGTWKFITAQEGLAAWVQDEPAKVIYYNGTSWGDVPTSVSINPSIPVSLVGNGATGVQASFVSNGSTTSNAHPEFQGVYGLTSAHGAGAGANGNKVTLYAGITSGAGTGNTSATNFLNYLPSTLAATSSFFQTLEIDFQNDSQNLGGAGGITTPGSVGLQITAATNASLNGGIPYLNNAAVWITGLTDVWHNGIIVSGNSVKDITILDSGHATTSYRISGSHAWGVDFSGGTFSSLAMRCANNMACVGAINAAGNANVVMSRLDASDRLILGEAVTTTRINSSQFEFSGSTMKIGGIQVVGPRDTGWTAMTGTPDEATSYATGSITLPQLAGRVMALQAALTTHGLIGP